VNALTRLYGRPEIVDLLIEARANEKTGTLPRTSRAFRLRARALVRPLASRDPAEVKTNIETERKAISVSLSNA
jgi:hypothetical protein